MQNGLKHRIRSLLHSPDKEMQLLALNMGASLSIREKLFLYSYVGSRRYKRAMAKQHGDFQYVDMISEGDVLIVYMDDLIKHNIRRDGIKQNNRRAHKE